MEEATLPPLPPSLSALYPTYGECYTTSATATPDDNISVYTLPPPLSLSPSTTNQYYTTNNNNIYFSPLPCSNNNNNNNYYSLNAHTVGNETFYEPEKPLDFFARNASFYIPNNALSDYCCSFSSSSSSLNQQQQNQEGMKTFDFFSAAPSMNQHHQGLLPKLRSFESPPPSPKRRRCLASAATTRFRNDKNRETGRSRRQTLSEMTSRLRKLMPLDEKMDVATTLEEAYKYVKFLQAQVKVLRAMPPLDRYNVANNRGFIDFNGMGMAAVLGVLSRQQMLEVVLGSRTAQNWLYLRGHCVCSIEQVVALKKTVEKKQALRRLVEFGCSSGGRGSC